MLKEEDLRILKAQFAGAGVPLRVADAPFVRGVRNAAIVQMDIRNRSKRGKRVEEVVIWPGEAERLDVLGIDTAYQQVVLLVKEPQAVFEESVRRYGRELKFQRHTSGAVRRFLIGMDEQHLFIAPLSTAAGSVREAHAQLQPRAVADARARGTHVVRQGEWFFVAADDTLQARIAEQVRRLGVERHVAIGQRPWGRFASVARGHVVDERIFVRLPAAQGPNLFEFWECVRGHVRHPDHKVLVLKGWHRVQRNTEAGARDGFVLSNWVD
jgi:hypothetical protein